MKRQPPNPAGREGKPISVYPYTFDQIVEKMLATPPPKHEPKPAKQHRKTKSKK
jgi:hypothetical protein